MLLLLSIFLQKAKRVHFVAGKLKKTFFVIWLGSRFIFGPKNIFSSIVQLSGRNSLNIFRQKAVAPLRNDTKSRVLKNIRSSVPTKVNYVIFEVTRLIGLPSVP